MKPRRDHAPSAPVDYEARWLRDEVSRRSHVTALLEQLRVCWAIHDRDVLELGSGIGTNLLGFATANRVFGVEGLPEAVEESLRAGIPTVRADLEQTLPLPDAVADWVLCLDVLEHLRRPEACLLEVRRVLRPGGRVVINLPNHFDWRGRLRILCGSGIDSQRYFPQRAAWRYPHLRFFRRADLTSLLDATGLVIEAEWSDRMSSFPKARRLAGLGLGPALRWLARRGPDFWQAGFFLVCRVDPGC